MATNGTTSSSVDAQIAELRSNQASTKADIAELKTSIGALMAEVRARSQTPWPVIWSAAGVIVAILLGVGTALYAPIARDIERLSSHIDKIGDDSVTRQDFDRLTNVVTKLDDTAVSRADLETRLATSGARRDDWQRTSEARSQANRDAIDRLQASVVPRGEHEEHWHAVDARFVDAQRQIDELRARAEALYGPRDELTRLSKEVDDLRARLSKLPP